MLADVRAKFTWSCALIAVLGGGLAGCDAGDDEAAEAIQEVEVDVLAELSAPDGARVKFTHEPVDLDAGVYSVGITIVGPGDGVPYGRHIRDQGLTPLEIFAAFAPTGAEPPPELVADHAAAVALQGRASAELRALVLPRAIETSPNDPVCDSFTAFEDEVGDALTSYIPFRLEDSELSAADHDIAFNGYNVGYGLACNRDDATSDEKSFSMCRKTAGAWLWSCDTVTLDDGEYGWKYWSSVASGGMTYTSFDYKVSATNTSGSVTSYLGLVVASILI